MSNIAAFRGPSIAIVTFVLLLSQLAVGGGKLLHRQVTGYVDASCLDDFNQLLYGIDTLASETGYDSTWSLSAGSGGDAASAQVIQSYRVEKVGELCTLIVIDTEASISASTSGSPGVNHYANAHTSNYPLIRFRVENVPTAVTLRAHGLAAIGGDPGPDYLTAGAFISASGAGLGVYRSVNLQFGYTPGGPLGFDLDTTIMLNPGDYYVETGVVAICQLYGDPVSGTGSASLDLEIAFALPVEIRVVDNLNAPLSNSQLKIAKVGFDAPNFSESLQQSVTTDADGKFALPGGLATGDSIKISKVLHSEPAKKHIGVLGTMYSVSLDNARFWAAGVVSFDELDGTPLQTIILDHTTVAYNALVSIEWDAASQYLERTQTAFRNMSNYLYDVTDGQARFDTVLIVDDKEFWEVADFQIYASNAIWPHVDDAGGLFRPTGPDSDPVEMPRFWNGSADDSRNLNQSDTLLNLTESVEFRTRVHEYGHYGFKFGDEYVFTNALGQCAAVANYGFMYDHYEDATDPYTTEMSSDARYSLAACQNTNHWADHGRSCWRLFEDDFENFYGPENVFAEIYMPAERGLPAGVDYLVGPNDDASALNYDIGSRVVFPAAVAPPAGQAVGVCMFETGTVNALPNVAVGVELPGGAILTQGYTSDIGCLYILGAVSGCTIIAGGQVVVQSSLAFGRASGAERWFSGKLVYDGSPGPIEMALRQTEGSFPFNVRLSLNPAAAILDYETAFSEPPMLKHITPAGVSQSSFLEQAGSYASTISGVLSPSGELRVEAKDAVDSIFFVSIPYSLHDLLMGGGASRVSAHDGSALLDIDAANTGLSQVLIATSIYPVLRSGLDSLAIQAGAAQTLDFAPAAELSGVNELTIRYFDSDLTRSARGFGDEASLRIHFWDPDSLRWILMGGTVDTAFNEVAATVSASGIYAAFTTADIQAPPCGDVDASGQLDITDAVYLINYIFASGPSPQDEANGDVDCSNQTDITDAVYLINYIFAGGAPPCAACK